MTLTGVDAVHFNMVETWRALSAWPQARFVEDGVTWFESPLPAFPFGFVVVDAPTDEAAFDAAAMRVQAHARDQQRTAFWVHTPGHGPADTPQRLAAAGFSGDHATMVTRPLDDVPAFADERLRVGPAAPGPALDAYVALEIERWGNPDAAPLLRDLVGFMASHAALHPFVLERDGTVVARALMTITGPFCGLYAGYVRPEMRKEGLGEAIIVAGMQEGKRLGATVATAQANPMSVRIVKRLGFAEHGLVTLFEWSPQP